MKKEKKIYEKWWFWVLAILLFFYLVGSIGGDDGGKSNQTDASIPIVEKNEAEKKPIVNRWSEMVDSIISTPGKKVLEIGDNRYSNYKFSISNRMIFDRYGDRYHYKDAQRGDKYVTSNITIKSSSKNPMLHAFGLYYLDQDSSLRLVGVMNYRLYRWEDYGTYLGNYNDNKNDFAYTESIRFVVGTPIKQELLKNRLFVITKKEASFLREFERFRNPPVYYEHIGSMLNKINKSYDWENNGYTMILEVKK